ncbi:hypothetical protein EK21DRAFT_87937 [Setomelanomma holmii]|uniref:Uncharacterized protein n=1 Tax=Setomelanomma holmii TaxID=210430 RepID=A0A9P4HBR9_9PLEO|nr:hypothetical protein EK21DRAFT_87937 [Setomelanomma holmii]
MRFTYIVPALITLSAAMPANSANPNGKTEGLREKGDCPNTGSPGSVCMCSKPNFEGDCDYHPYTSECFVPKMTIKSLGPDAGGTCTTYTSNDCSGRKIFYCVDPAATGSGYSSCNPVTGSIGCPGYSDFQESPEIKSIKCEKTEGGQK